jgi:adenylate cyclase
MQVPIPENETERLAALRTYEILDSAPEAAYDELTELAAHICQTPVAAIGLTDEKRDWKKSKYGLPPNFRELPRELSICSQTICGNDLLHIPDLSRAQEYSDHPMVAGEPYVRFYCGMPLINPEGYALGTICVIDFQPRDLTFEQGEALRRLSHQAVGQLELRRSLLELDRRMHDLERARGDIASEQEKSERLLLNILPRGIAEELKRSNRSVPRFYDSATVLFTDFESFTKLTERMGPKDLVDQLDQFFSAFDDIADRHRMEKLKTIGDAYMCAGGLPEPNRTHPLDACLAALAIQDHMARVNRQRERLRLPRWELRLGLHTGPVIAGVVGQRKFIYDVWGDAVNIAARMESSGVPGRINLSEAIYQRVKGLFDCEARGSIEAKNKGPLNMYFLNRIRPELSRDAEGIVPNGAFLGECARLFPGYIPVGAEAGPQPGAKDAWTRHGA